MPETGTETGGSSLKKILAAEREQRKKKEKWEKEAPKRQKGRIYGLYGTNVNDIDEILASQHTSEKSPVSFSRQAKDTRAFALEQSKARIK